MFFYWGQNDDLWVFVRNSETCDADNMNNRTNTWNFSIENINVIYLDKKKYIQY